MRSAREVAFRFRQEASNLRLWAFPPSAAAADPSPLAGLPDPGPVAERLRGTAFATEVIRLAEMVLEHRIPLFGSVVQAGAEIDWRRDYIHGVSSGLRYARIVKYMDFAAVGDHKNVWELNRHQHLVLLAQAWRLSGRRELLTEMTAQVNHWIEVNPYQRGINWASALEVAFRALSWIWIYHLAGASMEPGFRSRFLTVLYRHGTHLEANLSVYFSPNTHLLGEAVALHALGLLFPSIPRAGLWARQGAQIVSEEMKRQVREDGSHFEQSTYYHLYALDMFLFHYILAKTAEEYSSKLLRMAEYLAALTGDEGILPMLGDDDGGRFFHPYGPRERFGRATLATCGAVFDRPEWLSDSSSIGEQAAWWLDKRLPEQTWPQPAVHSGACLFPDAGVAVIDEGGLHLIVDAGPFGGGAGGHSHSDTLSIVARAGPEEILVDPGTYTYVSDHDLRNLFRGSGAHNTLRVDGADQGVPGGPFSWRNKPEVRLLGWRSEQDHVWLDVECCYAGIQHRRGVLLLRPHVLFVMDEASGPNGRRVLEQCWHFGEKVAPLTLGGFRIGSRTLLSIAGFDSLDLSEGHELGWRSPVFGTKLPALVLRARRECELPSRIWAVLDFSGPEETCLSAEPGARCVYRTSRRKIVVQLQETAPPVWETAAV